MNNTELEERNGSEGALTIDTTSGISAEEQREIIANIDAIAGATSIAAVPRKIAARKRGVLFPLIINCAALVLLAGGVFLLWRFFKEDDTVIRMTGSSLDSAEGRLIEEIRGDFDAAREEIARLTSNLEKATAFEWQMSGFYKTVNDAYTAGKLADAQAILRSMREFINTPSFAGIRQIEERREINMAMLDAMTRLIDESIRTSRVTEELNEAAQMAERATLEKEDALRRVEELDAERAALAKTAEQRAATLTERDRVIGELRAQTTDLRDTITTQEQRISTLTTQNATLTQRLSAVQQALSPAAD
ncbi:MAG: hypothetical protein LBD22_01220 [Spirochaetaceae bacterium]|jgi:hypothetical protein|nr:hypothetical protein [Spirochaetaceae bacterium]